MTKYLDTGKEVPNVSAWEKKRGSATKSKIRLRLLSKIQHFCIDTSLPSKSIHIEASTHDDNNRTTQ